MTPNPLPDPPPSISAAELRRRLLASTPPPVAAPAGSNAALDLDAAAQAVGVSSYGSSLDALQRLRLPGKPGSADTPHPTAATSPAPRRNSVIGLPTAGFAASIPVGSGVVGAPPPRQAPGGSHAATPGSGVQRVPAERPSAADDSKELKEIRRLKSENKELRQLLAEMKQLLQEASDNEQRAAAREQELQAAVAQKQRQVEELSSQIQAIEEQISSGALAPQQPATPPKSRGELEEWADELEKDSSKVSQERKRLDDERRQLREDEEALERQMRDMEVAMARERALMARQETELKRLNAEIQHELELLQRGDTTLRDQMQKFQRRAADVMHSKNGPPSQVGMSNPGLPPPRR